MPLRGPPPQLAFQVDRAVPGLVGAFAQRVNRIRGVSVATSWWRSPADNQSVGGAPDSQHLFALGVDLVGDNQQILADARALGLIAVDSGRHVHVQGWPKGIARSSGFLAWLGL